MKNWLKKLHDWGFQWANSKWGAWALFICAFADASFLPLPTPLFFLTITLLNVNKAYKYALLGTLGTLFGSMAGYSIGHFAWLNSYGDFTGLAQFMLNNIPGFSIATYNEIQTLYVKWDYWILFIAALIPLPYKIFSISSGLFDINIFIFCASTLIGQGLKFYLLAFFITKTGASIKRIIELNMRPIAIIATVCIALALVAIKLF